MLPYHRSLSVSSTTADPDDVVLVPFLPSKATVAESGYHAIDPREAFGLLEKLDGNRLIELRAFAAEARLSAFPLQRMDGREVLNLIREGVRSCRLVVLQKGAVQSAGGNATAELRRLVAQVEKETRGKLLFRGRQYKLAVGDDLAKVPGRDYYEIVGQTEAREVLDGVAQAAPSSSKVLGEARQRISKDWRAPFSQPEGLVLLRRIPVQAAAPKEVGPALTPSEIKQLISDKLKEELVDWKIWIELDPNDPKAKDDTVILLDACHDEVERKALAGCPREGEGVVVTFEKIEKHSRYTLIRDYGPDEGGGADTLFIDRSPADLEEETGTP